MEYGPFILLAVFLGALAATLLFVFGVLRLLFGSLALRLWKSLFRPSVKRAPARLPHPLSLSRTRHNPILRESRYEWEKEAVMNPAAFDAGGRTHLFYRAIGNDGVSRLGYASSSDGTRIDERLPYPVYAALDPRGRGRTYRYDPVLYPSGGSWGGAEDPRGVVIDNRLYLTFNMFDGWDFMRVAVMSLGLDDLMHKRWNWSAPKFLSREGERHKNWVLFPEKIGGQFAFLHNLHGEAPDRVRVDYARDLAFFDPCTINSPDPNALPDRRHGWHKRMRSAGPPPINTPFGWLLLYHATDEESHRYKMGAMLLDRDDPERIIAQAPAPILTPDAHYVNRGKPGVIYACGATVKNGMLQVYYGGGDKVVCTASAHLTSFVQALRNHRTPRLALA
ncbi:MAG TPA: hypothetical protein VFY28_01565 [Candidatus Paceibacterota bacterium]|nr:hypothetical protein [Candidatus Paceibacterota bacterium]